MNAKIIAVLAAFFVFGLSGCGKTGQYDTDGIAYLAYTDIDTVFPARKCLNIHDHQIALAVLREVDGLLTGPAQIRSL